MKTTAGVLCLLLLISCSKKDTPSETKPLTLESARAIGDRVAGALGNTLKGALSAAMKTGGPLKAISVCSKKAYALTDSIERLDPNVVHLKRTSLRIRNPKNASDSSEVAAIVQFEEQMKFGGFPGESIILEESAGDRKQFRYFKPVVVEPVCLICHGTPEYLNKDILAEIGKTYPNDQATGFREGDLRGVISVVIRAGSTGQDEPSSAPSSAW